jgi:hypothetical protein
MRESSSHPSIDRESIAYPNRVSQSCTSISRMQTISRDMTNNHVFGIKVELKFVIIFTLILPLALILRHFLSRIPDCTEELTHWH